MATRPNVRTPVEYGNDTDFWVEYPTGLIDISRKTHLQSVADSAEGPPPLQPTQVDIKVDRGKTVRIDKETSAIVIIDMQK